MYQFWYYEKLVINFMKFVRFEIFMVVKIKFVIFWVVAEDHAASLFRVDGEILLSDYELLKEDFAP
jgi:hypothetical protein